MKNDLLNAGLWEFAYERFSQDYLSLIKEKAETYDRLNKIDLIELSNEEAKKNINQLHILDYELKTFYSLKLIVDELKEAYNNSLSRIIDEEKQRRKSYKSKRLGLILQVIDLKSENQILTELSHIILPSQENFLDIPSQIISKTSHEHSK